MTFGPRCCSLCCGLCHVPTVSADNGTFLQARRRVSLTNFTRPRRHALHSAPNGRTTRGTSQRKTAAPLAINSRSFAAEFLGSGRDIALEMVHHTAIPRTFCRE
jgi:hypothetical protein